MRCCALLLWCILVFAACTVLGAPPPQGVPEEQPVLKIRGATDAEGLKVTTTSPDFTWTFYVESMNRLPVDDLGISVADFVGPDSQLAKAEWKVDGKPPTPVLRVPGLGSLKLDVSARLVREGPYTGSISLIYHGKRWPVPIVVTRARAAPTIKIDELPDVRAASLWDADPDCG